MAITTLERVVPSEQTWSRGALALAPALQAASVQALAPSLGPERIASVATKSAPLRLTRRGRLTLSLVAMACALGIGGLAYSSPAGEPAVPASSATTVVVAPGESVWEIARRADPQADPRATVARIIELNALSDGQVTPGQRLRLR